MFNQLYKDTSCIPKLDTRISEHELFLYPMLKKNTNELDINGCNLENPIWRFPEIGVPPNHPF